MELKKDEEMSKEKRILELMEIIEKGPDYRKLFFNNDEWWEACEELRKIMEKK